MSNHLRQGAAADNPHNGLMLEVLLLLYLAASLIHFTHNAEFVQGYPSLGFDGLLHYTRAPIAAHTHGMNFTIGFEVVAAAILLLYLVVRARRSFGAAVRRRG